MRRTVVQSHLALAAALVLTGCFSKQAYDGLPRVPVEGTVTFDGKPAQGAAISFVPVDPALRRANGFVGRDGTYSLIEGQGPNIGRYKVVINWPEEPPEGSMAIMPERLPARYNTASDLQVEFAAGLNKLDFQLTSK